MPPPPPAGGALTWRRSSMSASEAYCPSRSTSSPFTVCTPGRELGWVVSLNTTMPEGWVRNKAPSAGPASSLRQLPAARSAARRSTAGCSARQPSPQGDASPHSWPCGGAARYATPHRRTSVGAARVLWGHRRAGRHRQLRVDLRQLAAVQLQGRGRAPAVGGALCTRASLGRGRALPRGRKPHLRRVHQVLVGVPRAAQREEHPCQQKGRGPPGRLAASGAVHRRVVGCSAGPRCRSPAWWQGLRS